jgi:hypothetical protein
MRKDNDEAQVELGSYQQEDGECCLKSPSRPEKQQSGQERGGVGADPASEQEVTVRGKR